MDESAFPILLLDRMRPGCPEELSQPDRWWSMVRRATGFLVGNGPVAEQDRWEEDAEYSRSHWQSRFRPCWRLRTLRKLLRRKRLPVICAILSITR